MDADSTDDEEIANQIGTGECLTRKTAVLNCNSLTAMALLLAFALFQEISPPVQRR